MARNNWYVNIDTYFDSHLEINSAISILSGDWMGSYDKFILCKNPSYPLFLALLYILHLPYAFGLSFYILLSVFLLIYALKPLIKNDYVKSIIFLFALFNPVVFIDTGYHYRNALVPWSVLSVIACIIGIYLRKDEKLKSIVPFSLIGMINMGFFWLLREDSIWFLPFVGMAFLITIIYWIKNKVVGKKLVLSIFLASLPLLGVVIANLGISTINYSKYGIFATNDRTKTSEADVLGLLISIDDKSDLENDVWVSDEAIKIAKSVSPTFDSLNLTAFDNWPKIGDYSIWALRDSLADSGYYINAKETEKVYKKIKKELKEAFDEGKIKKKKGIQLSSTSGIYSFKELLHPLLIGIKSIYNHVIYNHVNIGMENIINYQNDSDLLLYEKVLNVDLVRSNEELSNINANNMLIKQNDNLLRSKYHINYIDNKILDVYKITGGIIFIVSLIGYGYYIVNIIKRKKIKFGSDIALIGLGLLLSTYLNAYLVGLWGTGFGLTADSDLFCSYTSAQYILISVFEILGLFGVLNLFLNKKK